MWLLGTSLMLNGVLSVYLFQLIDQRHQVDAENAALSWAAFHNYTRGKK